MAMELNFRGDYPGASGIISISLFTGGDCIPGKNAEGQEKPWRTKVPVPM